MDPRSTPFSGKTGPTKQNNNRKTTDLSKTITKELPNSRQQKRVFGTTRSTNIPTKTITEKRIIKHPIGVPQKQPKQSQLTPPPPPPTTTTNVATNPKTESSKQSSPEKPKPKPKLKKKSVCIQKQSSQNKDNALQEESVIAPKTPVAASPSLNKAKIAVGTPYHTAENCSKCRFDRLETSSYWLGQIKLSESVGKHFVSAAFFRLAFESKAEPTRNLRIELKRYLARHGYLSAQTEWRDCSFTYGLLEDEKNAKGKNLGIGEAGTSETTCGDIDQDQKEGKGQSLEQLKPQSN